MTLSLAAIFGAGVLTFASPCVLPLIPVYLSLLAGTSVGEVRAGGGRAWLLATSAAFALGLALVFIALGMAATAGRALLAHRALLTRVGGVAVIVFGLKSLGVLRVPWLEREFRPGVRALGARGGLLAALLFGAAFGLGWTPCIGPVLGAVLTYTASATASPWTGGLYLAVYAAGLALPLVVTAAIAPLALAWLRRAQAHVRRVEVATGAALVLTGALLATNNLGALSADAPTPEATAPRAATAPCETRGARDAVICGVPATATTSVGTAPAALPPAPLLVEFVSRTCPVCERMAPVVQAMEQACAGAGVAVHPVDVGSPAGQELARRHGVLGVPTFVALDGAHREQARLVGEQPRDRLVGAVEALAGARCAPPTPTHAAAGSRS